MTNPTTYPPTAGDRNETARAAREFGKPAPIIPAGDPEVLRVEKEKEKEKGAKR